MSYHCTLGAGADGAPDTLARNCAAEHWYYPLVLAGLLEAAQRPATPTTRKYLEALLATLSPEPSLAAALCASLTALQAEKLLVRRVAHACMRSCRPAPPQGACMQVRCDRTLVALQCEATLALHVQRLKERLLPLAAALREGACGAGQVRRPAACQLSVHACSLLALYARPDSHPPSGCLPTPHTCAG
jgi:hypothetical protein